MSVRAPLLSEAGGVRRTTAVLLTLGLVFALYDLGGRSLHDMDTPRWGQLAREMIRSGEWLVPTRYGEIYANKPPLYLWAVAGPSAVHGEVNAFLVRLPAALGFVLLVLGAASWARVRTGSESIARMAGLITLSTFSVAWLAREGRLDMFGAGIATMGAVALDRAACGKGTRFTPWIAGLWLGAALLTKGPPLLLIPIAILFAPQREQRLGDRLRRARPHVVFGVAIAVALAWFVPAVLHGGWETYGRLLLVDQATDRIAGQANHLHPWWRYALLIPTRMIPWGPVYVVALLLALSRPGRRGLGPVARVVVAALVVCIVFSLVPTKHVRYLAPVVPMLALAPAWWGECWAGRAARDGDRGWVAMFGTIALLGGGAGLVAAFFAGLLPPVTLPGLALLLVGGLAHRHARLPAPRRRALATLLLVLVCFVLLACTLRYRFRDRNKVRFNRSVAQLVDDRPVYTLYPVRPEDVFDGAPQAQRVHDPHGVARDAFVVLQAGALPVLREAHPRARVVIQPEGRHQFVVVYVRP